MNIKKNMKPFVMGFLVCLLLSSAVYAQPLTKNISVVFSKVKIMINGTQAVPKSEAFTYNKEIYVPLKFITEALGKSYSYDAKTNTVTIGAPAAAGNVIKSEDSKVQVTASKDWGKTDLLKVPGASLVIMNTKTQAGFVVLGESKGNFSSGVDLDKYYDLQQQFVNNMLENPVVSEKTKLTINGYPALQFEVQGEAMGLKLKYLITLIDTPDSFYKVTGYSGLGDYEKNKADLIAVTNSFKVISTK